MSDKKINLLFLTIIIVHIIAMLLISFTPITEMIGWNMLINALVSEMIIWVPTLIFLVVTKTNPIKLCRFRAVKPATLLMTVLFTMFCSPIVTLVNALSMLFVDNTVLALSGDVLEMPFALMFLMMAVYGPFAEEFVFRGVLYQGYKSGGSSLKAILLSALLFGLMHMNFNQAAYAFVIGIFLALLMEASDSIWPVFLVHFLINGFSVISMYVMDAMSGNMSELLADTAMAYTQEELLMVISVYFLLAVICTPVACCILAWIAGKENRKEAMCQIWQSRKGRGGKIITISLILAVLLCLIFMLWEVMM